MGDIEAAIVLEELGRADVSSAILAQLIFNGPPRAIEHLGNDAHEGPVAPARGERRRRCSASASARPRPARRSTTCAPASPPTATASASTRTRTTSPAGTRRACCLVWCRFPGQRGHEGHRRGRRRPRGADGVTVAGTHVKMGLRGTSEAELAFDDVRIEPDDVLLVRRPDEQRVVQDADRAHQPRALRQRGDVHRRRAGRARVRGPLHERAHDRRQAARRASRACSGRSPTWRTQLEGARLLLQRAVHLAGPARHAARARDRDGEDRRQPRGQVRVRRGDPAARRLRLLAASTRSSACTATSAGCASAPAPSRSSATSSARSVLRGATPASDGWKLPRSAEPEPSCSRRRTGTRGAADVPPAPGGPWDVPSLDALARRDRGVAATLGAIAWSRASPAGCARAGVRRGDVVAWQAPNCDEVVRALPRVLAARRGRGADPPPRRAAHDVDAMLAHGRSPT